jgi:hypothetical protein
MKLYRMRHRLLLAAALAVAAACSTKSPTEPGSGTPSSPKVPESPQGTFNISINANPKTLTVGTGQSSTITLTATNTQNGGAPPNLTPVTLTTSNGQFNSNTSGLTSIPLQLVNGQAQAVLFPSASAGPATLAAILAPVAGGPCGGTGTTTACVGSGAGVVNIVGASTFFLNGVSPTFGDPAGGFPVTITGGGFLAPVSVQFGGSSAAVRSVGPSSIVVTAPPSSTPVAVGSTLQVSISVNNNLGGTQQGTATLNNVFTYAPGGGIQQPQIFSVSPASGVNDGGTQVSIVGEGFQSPVQVFFGQGNTAAAFSGVEATVSSVTPTKIVVISPPARGFGQDNTNQLVGILVKNLNNGFSTIATSAFKYGSKVIITSAGPTQTLFNVPVKVTIFGQGFVDPVAVSLAGVAAQVLSVTGTQIVVLSGIPTVTSCNDVTGAISVTNINNGDGSNTGPTFDYQVPHPFITSISPSSGTGNGNTQVKIVGGGFEPNPPFGVNVQFGNQTGAVDSVNSNPNLILATTPMFTGTYPTQACTSQGVQGTMNLPDTVSVEVIDLVTTCSVTVQNAFSFIPPDQSCHVVITPPGAPVASFTFTESTGSDTVIFKDSSTGPPTAWSWNFGDGDTSNTQNPVHTYATAGTFVVTLQVSNSTGTSSTSQFVTVPGP